MRNEILLIVSLIVVNFTVVAFHKFLKEEGLYVWTAIATISANIEVMIIVNAFGMEQTLGNILFASTFLVTDICSELYGKKSAQKAVYVGIAVSAAFVVISQTWLLYVPNSSDFIMPHMKAVFSNTPRVMIVGLVVYAVVQMFDVWVYHKWWELTTRLTGDNHRFLWLRNNGSTLLSQLLNTVLFTWGVFFGVYETKTLINIAIASYVIFIVTSLADTPFIYLARKLNEKKIS